MTGTIHLERNAHVASVTLDAPGKLNAISEAMWQQLARIFEELGADAEVRVAMLRGAGGNFAAGADMEEFERLRFDELRGRRYHLETIGNAVSAIQACKFPVIASIEGVCVGGGLELAVACDLRLAADNARVGIPVARLGFPLALPALAPLLRLVGPGVAAELLLESRILPAAEALIKGLLTRVVPSERLTDETQLMCAHVAANSPLANRDNKLHIQRLMVDTLAYTGRELDDSFAFLDSADYHEGVRAFLAKRPPVFRGK